LALESFPFQVNTLDKILPRRAKALAGWFRACFLQGMIAESINGLQTVETANSLRDQIVLDNLSLVRAIAVRVRESLPVHVDLDDLIHAGVMGLFDAATKYDSAKEVAFKSYAKHRIKGAMLDSLRQADWASRDLRKRHKQLESAMRELTAKLKRPPSESEIAERMGVDVERWRQMAVELRVVGLISGSSRLPEAENETAPEFPASEDTRPDNICERKQLGAALETAIKTLPERYQKVVIMYYSKDMTMKEIGAVLDINESRVSQIHKTALEKMAVALQSAGIHSSQAFV
jgi:RNA polymerase sigma factor for flagellar operon FliA